MVVTGWAAWMILLGSAVAVALLVREACRVSIATHQERKRLRRQIAQWQWQARQRSITQTLSEDDDK